jgi:hypothetical protein
LSTAQLEQYQPNELGVILILEYHAFTQKPEDDTDFIRYIGNFQKDLEWLYKHDFYVVPLRDVITNRISAPLGKHPVALTFDDSTPGQFRFLKQSDGTLKIDPKSAIAVLENFFQKHPDFGRGGFFAALAPKNVCFSWSEEDQEPYCQQKIKWLLDHGYEIGNHTLNHLRIDKLDVKDLASEVAEPFSWFAKLDKRAKPDILSIPFGEYPDGDQQLAMLRKGFRYQGKTYKLIGCLMVGSQGSPSPSSTEWNSLYIPRIQVSSGTQYGTSSFWFPQYEADPSQLYVSDGNPDVVTAPKDEDLPVALAGTMDDKRLAAEGITVFRY